ncbi:hypothetical protein ACJX0J_010030, partial [Zea mays]
MNWEEKINHHGSGAKQSSADHAFMIGSYLDVPIGQEITSSGMLLTKKLECLTNVHVFCIFTATHPNNDPY